MNNIDELLIAINNLKDQIPTMLEAAYMEGASDCVSSGNYETLGDKRINAAWKESGTAAEIIKFKLICNE